MEISGLRQDEKGNPLFCLTDLCKILSLDNVSMVRSRLNQDGVITTEGVVKTGKRSDGSTYEQSGELIFVMESNLYRVIFQSYRVIFQSRKPDAEKFTDWVTKDVLPSIRKNGYYKLDTISQKDLARMLYEAEEAKEKLMAKNQKQTLALNEAAPKLLFAYEVGILFLYYSKYSRSNSSVNEDLCCETNLPT